MKEEECDGDEIIPKTYSRRSLGNVPQNFE